MSVTVIAPPRWPFHQLRDPRRCHYLSPMGAGKWFSPCFHGPYRSIKCCCRTMSPQGKSQPWSSRKWWPRMATTICTTTRMMPRRSQTSVLGAAMKQSFERRVFQPYLQFRIAVQIKHKFLFWQPLIGIIKKGGTNYLYILLILNCVKPNPKMKGVDDN